MPAVLVAAAASAWLLVGAGLMKIQRPEGTREAIKTLVGVTGPPWQSRLLGTIEVVVGAAFIVAPGVLSAVALGLAYAVTFGSAIALRRRDVDCGCFGDDSSKVGTAHLVVTALATLAAFAMAVVFEPYRGLSVYALVAAGIPVALGCYALIAPLTALRSQLAGLSS